MLEACRTRRTGGRRGGQEWFWSDAIVPTMAARCPCVCVVCVWCVCGGVVGWAGRIHSQGRETLAGKLGRKRISFDRAWELELTLKMENGLGQLSLEGIKLYTKLILLLSCSFQPSTLLSCSHIPGHEPFFP